jgi:hypothetical protein
MEGGSRDNENRAAWSDPMKEIVLVTLVMDTETGERSRFSKTGPRKNRPPLPSIPIMLLEPPRSVRRISQKGLLPSGPTP